MTEHNSPDRNTADEQRQAHQRDRFLHDCAQDGLPSVNSAELTERPVIIGWDMGRTEAATQPATARERRRAAWDAMVDRFRHGGILQLP